MAFRVDIGQLKPPRRLADGRLVAEGLLSRAGVFVYRNQDGTERRELRPPEEVFRSDSLETFSLAPVTNDHPPELVSSKNAKRYTVGSVGENVKRDDEFVRAKLTVYDADVIGQMERGKAALSCGYEVDLDETPGEHPLYGRYDAIQRNIRGNHVAIVDSGRAGDAARVRMDAAVMQRQDPPSRSNMPNETSIEQVLAQLAIQTKRADDAEKLAATEKTRADRAEGEMETLKKRLDSVSTNPADVQKLEQTVKGLTDKNAELEATLSGTEARRREDARKLFRIVDAAREVLGVPRVDEILGGEFTDRQLMAAVIEKTPVLGDKVPEDAADAWIESRFDSCVRMYRAGERGKQSLRDLAPRADQKPIDLRSAREKHIERMNQRGRNVAQKES